MSDTSAQTSKDVGEERLLATRVARRYFIDDASKVVIASEFGISRFKVARILEFARAEDLVTITINDAGMVDAQRSERLAALLRLNEVHVVASHGPEEERRRQVGGAAANLLRDTLREGDVLGLAWGRTLTAMTEKLTELPRVSVVQLTGAVGTNLNDSPVEVVRRVARQAGVDARAIFAPLLVENAATATALRRQRDVASAMALFKDVTVAVLSVGAWDPPISQLREVMSDEDREILNARGVNAEIAGILLDKEGRYVGADFSERCISISPLELAKVPRVIAVAAGAQKASAVQSAAFSRLVSAIVVDQELADAILDARDD